MNKTNECNSELLTLYHYRELNAEQTREILAHLSHCSKCRAELQKIEAALANVPVMQLRIDAQEKQTFNDRILDKHHRRQWKKPVWGSALAATGALALALLLIPGSGTETDSNNQVLAELGVLEQMELLQDFDLLQDLELLEEMVVLR
jgi:anti-sigma factor RsiW